MRAGNNMPKIEFVGNAWVKPDKLKKDLVVTRLSPFYFGVWSTLVNRARKTSPFFYIFHLCQLHSEKYKSI